MQTMMPPMWSAGPRRKQRNTRTHALPSACKKKRSGCGDAKTSEILTASRESQRSEIRERVPVKGSYLCPLIYAKLDIFPLTMHRGQSHKQRSERGTHTSPPLLVVLVPKLCLVVARPRVRQIYDPAVITRTDTRNEDGQR